MLSTASSACRRAVCCSALAALAVILGDATGRAQPAEVPPQASGTAAMVGGSGVGLLPWLYLEGSLLRSSGGVTPEQAQAALTEYYTNGAEAASVPSSGPGAEYFTQGAALTAALPSVMSELAFESGTAPGTSAPPSASPPGPQGPMEPRPPGPVVRLGSTSGPAEASVGALAEQNGAPPVETSAPPVETSASPAETSTPPAEMGAGAPGETNGLGAAATSAPPAPGTPVAPMESEPGAAGAFAQPGVAASSTGQVGEPRGNPSSSQGAPEAMPSSVGLTVGTSAATTPAASDRRGLQVDSVRPAASCRQTVLTLLGGILVGALLVVTGMRLGRPRGTALQSTRHDARGG